MFPPSLADDLISGISSAEDIYRALGCKIGINPMARKEVHSATEIIELVTFDDLFIFNLNIGPFLFWQGG